MNMALMLWNVGVLFTLGFLREELMKSVWLVLATVFCWPAFLGSAVREMLGSSVRINIQPPTAKGGEGRRE